jgi:uncharacterized membrane protein YphA (DoxX/SURF4 family)
MSDKLTTAWWSLRIAFFLGPFLAGLDKFFHLLVNWDQYLSPTAQRILGSFRHPFMLIVGVVEMIVGIITRWTRLGAYIASVWLLPDRDQSGHDGPMVPDMHLLKSARPPESQFGSMRPP